MHRFKPRKKEQNVLGEVQNQQPPRETTSRSYLRRDVRTPSPSKSLLKSQQTHGAHVYEPRTHCIPEPAKVPLSNDRREKENTTPPRDRSEEHTHWMSPVSVNTPLHISGGKLADSGFPLNSVADGRNIFTDYSYALNEHFEQRHHQDRTKDNSDLFGKRQQTFPSENRSQHFHGGAIEGRGMKLARSPEKDFLGPNENERRACICSTSPVRSEKAKLSSEELDEAFECVLALENVPNQMRDKMRSLSKNIKMEFIRNSNLRTRDVEIFEDGNFPTSEDITQITNEERTVTDKISNVRPSLFKSSHSRGRSWKVGESLFRRPRSVSRPKSLMSLKNLSSSSINSLKSNVSVEGSGQVAQASTSYYVKYLQDAVEPKHIEIGRLHRLRQVLRNETVSWVDRFIQKGGMSALLNVLRKVMRIEWREEHEDLLLGELLKCLKALCSTHQALQALNEEKKNLFPEFLSLLFDEERKGPSEYSVRQTLINILFLTVQSANTRDQAELARGLLSFLKDPQPPAEEQPIDFVKGMHRSRPYQRWCREVVSVTREVFWIFMHHLNVVSPDDSKENNKVETYAKRHFPKERPPIPTAPYVGGVEWDAANYITAHLDLMNAIIAVLPDRVERHSLRADLKESGFEKCLGGSLRLCKEKFYGCVHDGLKTWVSAAVEDEWDTTFVRQGLDETSGLVPVSPRKKSGSPQKIAQAPKLDLPMLAPTSSGLGLANESWL